MAKRAGFLALLLAAVAVVVLLLWDAAGLGAFVDGWFRAGSEGGGEAEATLGEDALVEDLRERALLRGLPGVETAGGGTGRLTGTVKVHVPREEPRPLADVKVQALAVADGRTVTLDATTDAEGQFAFDPIPALQGWAVVVRHSPYKDAVQRGVVVAAGRATDVGTILLGAPTALAGEIVDAAGRPVPSAAVQVLRDADRREAVDFQRALADLQASVDPLAGAEADRDGRFLVEGLTPGRYVLRISAAGYATAFRDDVLVTVDERSADVRVILDPGAGWTGRVVDEEGRGVPGARIIAIPTPGGGISRLDRIETRSGADGAYRLDTLVSGLRYFVEAWAEGHAPSGRFLVPLGTTTLDLVVVTAGRIEGVISDETSGQGIEGAEVTVLAGLMNSLSPVAAVTDAAGRYAVPAVSPGPVLLFVARAPGWQRRNFDVGKGGPWRVRAGEALRMDLALPRGVTLAGRVVATDGSPVAYATVGVLDVRDRWEGERSAISDATGRYVIASLRPGQYEVRVSAPGYAPVTEEKDARFEIPGGVTEHVRDLVLARGGELRGTVKAPDGQAVTGARLQVTSPHASARNRVRDLAAVSDAAGLWRIPGVPLSLDLQVLAEHDAWTRTVTPPFKLASGESRDVEIVMKEGARLPGRATDARGTPVEGARVRWGPVGPGDDGRLRDAFRADELLGTRVLKTDDDGRFEIDRLDAGRYVVKIERDGFSDWYRKDVVVSGEGVQGALSAELEGALRIRGRVLDATSGGAIAGAWVYAKEEDAKEGEPTDPGRVTPLVSAQTEPDGTYVLDRLPPGRYEVAAWLALGYRASAQEGNNPAYKRHDVAAGSAGIDFRLAPDVPVPPR